MLPTHDRDAGAPAAGRAAETSIGTGLRCCILVLPFSADNMDFARGRAAATPGRVAVPWLGLVPRQHSTGGKARLGRITKAGSSAIHTSLVLGATAMVHRAGQWNSAAGTWARGVLERRPVLLATAALANKVAHIAWALMTCKKDHRPHAGRVLAAAAPEVIAAA